MYKQASYTFAIPGFWLKDEKGENYFSPYGEELTEEGKRIAHSFPCNCFKDIKPEHNKEVKSS